MKNREFHFDNAQQLLAWLRKLAAEKPQTCQIAYRDMDTAERVLNEVVHTGGGWQMSACRNLLRPPCPSVDVPCSQVQREVFLRLSKLAQGAVYFTPVMACFLFGKAMGLVKVDEDALLVVHLRNGMTAKTELSDNEHEHLLELFDEMSSSNVS